MQALIYSDMTALHDFVMAFENHLESSLTSSLKLGLWWLRDVESQRSFFALTGYRKVGFLAKLDLESFEGELTESSDQPTREGSGEVKLRLPPPLALTLGAHQGAQQSAQQSAIRCVVTRRRSGVSLKALMPLAPWRGAPPQAVTSAPLLFWVHDRDVATRLVTDHFKIGCDQIDYLMLNSHESETQENKTREDKTRESEALLFRVTQPSYYLTQRYSVEAGAETRVEGGAETHDEASDGTKGKTSDGPQSLESALIESERPLPPVRIYYELTEGLYVEWGYEPALIERWIEGFSAQAGLLTLLPMNLTLDPVMLEAPEWRSVYELTRFELDASPDAAWSARDECDVRFEIPLSLERRARALDPELWLIDAEDFDQLERRLSLIDQEDLNGLLISVQETAEGRRRFFVRERPGAERERSFYDLGGERYARYMGFHNLYLPIDIEVQPRLRRDQYPKIFELKNREFTILSLDEVTRSHEDTLGRAPSLSGATLYRIAEESFEPLGALTHYIINAASSALQRVAKQSAFTLSAYQHAPSLLSADRLRRLAELMSSRRYPNAQSDPRGGRREGDAREILEDEVTRGDERESELSRLMTTSQSQSSQRQAGQGARGDAQADEGGAPGLDLKPSALESRADELLSSLLADDGYARADLGALWRELAEIWLKLRAYRKALDAIIEGSFAWRAVSDERWTQLGALLEELKLVTDDAVGGAFTQTLEDEESDDPLTQARVELIRQPNAVESFSEALRALHLIERLPEARRHEPLTRYLALTEEVANVWRKKERWLIWLRLAKLNQDPRLLAREREALLDALNADGITRGDLPQLIIDRLLEHRALSSGEGDPDEGAELSSDPQDPRSTRRAHLLRYLDEIKKALTVDGARGQRVDDLIPLQAPLYVLLARAYHENDLSGPRDEALERVSSLLESTPKSAQCWSLAYLTRSPGLISRERVGEYLERFGALSRELNMSDQERIREAFQHLTQRSQRKRSRERAELSRGQTKQRLFLAYRPESDPELAELLASFMRSLQTASPIEVKTRFDALVDALVDELPTPSRYRPVSYCLYQVSEVSGKLKWLNESRVFMESVERLQAAVDLALRTSKANNAVDLYLNLAALSLSELTLRLGDHHHAQRQIKLLLTQLNDPKTQWLDHIDAASMALQSIEAISYEARSSLLGELLSGFRQLITRDHIGGELIICNFVEQLVDVVVSDDLLIANRFQERCDYEELTLRDALINDRL